MRKRRTSLPPPRATLSRLKNYLSAGAVGPAAHRPRQSRLCSSAGRNRGGGLYLTRVPSPTPGTAAGDWYTTANLLQFGARRCSIFSVVYPLREVATNATWGNVRGAANAAPDFVYNRKFAADRCPHLQQNFGCIPCRARKAAFAWKGTVPFHALLPESHLTVNLVHGEGGRMHRMCGLVRFRV